MAPKVADQENEAGKSQRVKKKEKQRRHSDRQKDLFELKGTYIHTFSVKIKISFV